MEKRLHTRILDRIRDVKIERRGSLFESISSISSRIRPIIFSQRIYDSTFRELRSLARYRVALRARNRRSEKLGAVKDIRGNAANK